MVEKIEIRDLINKNGKLSTLGDELNAKMRDAAGRFVKITVEFQDEAPTLSQYGYLYGCVYPNFQQFIAETQGQMYSIVQIDAICKETFFWSDEISEKDLRATAIPKRKSKNSKTALSNYIQSIIIALELVGWYVPSAQQYARARMIEKRTQIIYREL